MENIIYNTIGTIGVAIILTTYFLLQMDKLDSQHLRYSVLNFLGSGMILISLFHDFNLPSFIVEVAWVLISVFGMWRHWQQRSTESSIA